MLDYLTEETVKSFAEGVSHYVGERFRGPYDEPYDGPHPHAYHPRNARVINIIQAMSLRAGITNDEKLGLINLVAVAAWKKDRKEWDKASTPEHARQVVQGLTTYIKYLGTSYLPEFVEVKLLLDDIATYPPWSHSSEQIGQIRENVTTSLCSILTANNYTYTHVHVGGTNENSYTYISNKKLTEENQITDDLTSAFHFHELCHYHGVGPWPVYAQVYRIGDGGVEPPSLIQNALHDMHPCLLERELTAPQGDPVICEVERGPAQEHFGFPEM